MRVLLRTTQAQAAHHSSFTADRLRESPNPRRQDRSNLAKSIIISVKTLLNTFLYELAERLSRADRVASMKLDTKAIRYLTSEDWRILTAVRSYRALQAVQD